MNNKEFELFLENISIKPIFILDKEYVSVDYYPIDISEKNTNLEVFDISSASEWENYFENLLSKNNAKIAFGGYLEKRNLYDRSEYFKNQSVKSKRNIHLGIDLWCKVNTKVLAVLDGEIHSFKNNMNYGDYGPTIILKHSFENEVFYSLYGHLSIASIKYISIGSRIKQGEIIGFLGDSSVNGDYAPHLHFQIIRDLQDSFGDYAGVSSEENLDFYKNNCPDPNLLLKL